MFHKRSLCMVCLVAASLLLSGCASIHISFLPESCSIGRRPTRASQAEQASLPASAPAPTAIPPRVTVTPIPTSTPAPRLIGTKTTTSQYVYMTNNTAYPLREIYLRKTTDGTSWGKNIIPSDTTIKVGENVQMFYSPQPTDDPYYDMKVVDRVGNSYAIYGIDFSDMNSSSLRIEGAPYLKYISLQTGSEAQTDYSDILAWNYNASTYSADTSASETTDYESLYKGNPHFGYYGYEGEWSWYYSDSFMSHVGDSSYGYFDQDGDWIMTKPWE